MGFLDAVKPETTITLGFIGLMLAAAVYIVVKGVFIPRSTHLRELRALETQVAQAIKDRDEQVAAARLDRDTQVRDIREEMNGRMANFRADHALRVDQIREDYAKQVEALSRSSEGVRVDFATVLAAKQRDADDWRAAYHIIAENAKISEDRMDEVLETGRLIHALIASIRRSVPGETTNHREISSGSS